MGKTLNETIQIALNTLSRFSINWFALTHIGQRPVVDREDQIRAFKELDGEAFIDTIAQHKDRYGIHTISTRRDWCETAFKIAAMALTTILTERIAGYVVKQAGYSVLYHYRLKQLSSPV